MGDWECDWSDETLRRCSDVHSSVEKLGRTFAAQGDVEVALGKSLDFAQH